MKYCPFSNVQKKGEIVWVPLVAEDYWRVQLDGIWTHRNGTATANPREGTNLSPGANAILDTGTSLIAGPVSAVRRLNALIGATQPVDWGLQVLSCSSIDRLPTVEIGLAGRNFQLTPDDYVIQVRFLSFSLSFSILLSLSFDIFNLFEFCLFLNFVI